MTPAETEKETVRRLREAMARRQGPHSGNVVRARANYQAVLEEIDRRSHTTRCRWCQSPSHYSPACPEKLR